MDDRLYQVRVTALATDRIPPSSIHAAFAELFCLSLPEAEARLSALPLVVRGDLAADLARKYGRVLGRLGLTCEVLPQGEGSSGSRGQPLSAAEGRAGAGAPASGLNPDREPSRQGSPGAADVVGTSGPGGVAAPAGGPA